VVILNKSTFSFEDGNVNLGLLVGVGGEGLGLLGGDDRSTLDNGGHNSTDSLNTEGKRGNINKKDIFSFVTGLSSEDSTLNSGSVSDSFVGVNTAVGFLTVEEIFHHLLNLGDSGRSTNKDDFINFTLLHTGIIEDGLNGVETLLEKVGTEFLETSTGDSLFEINTINQTFNGNFSLNNAGKITLCLFNFLSELGESAGVFLDINSVLFLEGLDEMVSESLIEIFSSQMGITSSCDNFEDTTINSQK